MKNIVITGGCGFIGFNLAAKLMQEHDIFVIDNFNDFYKPEIKRTNCTMLQRFHQEMKYPTSLSLIEKDILKITGQDISHLEKENLIIIHLAAEPGVRESIGKENYYFRQNVTGTKTMLNIGLKTNPDLFINFSSSTVYGNNPKTPWHERLIPSPISPYGKSKWKAEQICSDFTSTSSFPILTFRPFSIYGPQQRPKMVISQFVKKFADHKPITVYGTGQQKRDFTYVDDLVKLILYVIDKQFSCDHHVFNIGYGSPVSINDLIQKLSNIFEYSPLIEYAHSYNQDAQITWASIDKLTNWFDFQPQISIDQGLNHYLQWNQNKSLKTS